jgi:hypothetical protein
VKLALRCAILAVAAASSVASGPAFTETFPPIDGPFEVSLDMDHDGKTDRAVMTRQAEAGLADLSIYLGVGDGKLAPSTKPTFLKTGLTAEGIIQLDDDDSGALLFTYGCGGCSNDYETTLTIAYRDGEFLVAGYIYAWETREAIGSCEIDYLAGKGVMTEGLDGAGIEIKEKFTPVKLADWSDDKRPRACEI